MRWTRGWCSRAVRGKALHQNLWTDAPRAVARVSLIIRENKELDSPPLEVSLEPLNEVFVVETTDLDASTRRALVTDSPVAGAPPLGWVTMMKDGEELPFYTAAMAYQEEGTPLVILAGKMYGAGSSRDWAAKGTKLQGVKAVIAESFERIHRSNLVGMGVLPLEFQPGDTRETYAIDGSEIFDVVGERKPGARLTVIMQRRDGETVEIPVTCRLDTADEVSVYEAGGVLQRFAQDFLEAGAAA